MSQHDMNIANQTAIAARTDINNALSSLASTSSGSSSPSTTFANQLWLDTTVLSNGCNLLKIRNSADTGWRDLFMIHPDFGIRLINQTGIQTLTGTNIGSLQNNSLAGWNAGTDSTNRLISASLLKDVISWWTSAYRAYGSFCVVDNKAFNANAQSSSAGWNIRELNTVRLNTIGSTASLSNNIITLPKGYYTCSFTAHGAEVGKQRLQLRTTVGTTLSFGVNSNMSVSNGSNTVHGEGGFQIGTGGANINLRHYINSAGSGFGIPDGSGEQNEYASVSFTKVKEYG